jgi:hypothetical protein
MERAINEFNNTKRLLEDATRRGDSVYELRKRLQDQATNIATRYGDRFEVGLGEWPFVKPRESGGGGMSPQQRERFNDIKREQPNASDDQILDYMRKKGWM